MCEVYPAIKKVEGLGRLLEGQCPDCPEGPPLNLHTHPNIARIFMFCQPTEWRFGLCPKCGKCWRCELSSEDGEGLIYEITPRCHLDFVQQEMISTGV